VAWKQKQKRLAVAGDLSSRIIRLWDIEAEKKVNDLPTGTDSSAVTCLAPDHSGKNKNMWFCCLLII